MFRPPLEGGLGLGEGGTERGDRQQEIKWVGKHEGKETAWPVPRGNATEQRSKPSITGVQYVQVLSNDLTEAEMGLEL